MQTCSKIWLSSVVLISSESVSNEGKSWVRSGLNKLRLWPLRKFKLSIHTNHWSPVCHCWTNCTTSIPLDVFNNAASHDVILFPKFIYVLSTKSVSTHCWCQPWLGNSPCWRGNLKTTGRTSWDALWSHLKYKEILVSPMERVSSPCSWERGFTHRVMMWFMVVVWRSGCDFS